MALESAKEMDRRCVLNWLNEVYVTPSRAFDEYTEDEIKMFAHDALVLLEEQEEQKLKWLKQITDAQIVVCRTGTLQKHIGLWSGLQIAKDILTN